MAPAPDREKALELALAQIDKQYGKGSVMRLGEEGRAPIEIIPTGSIALDVALGIGGLPRGRIVEIYGPESSGKTTVALHAVANAQKNGGIAAFIDAEHALDPDYARKLGVDTDQLLRAAARPRWPCTRSPTRRRTAGSPRSSTPSTRSTRTTPGSSAWTPTSCWSRSRIPVSRPWRSWTC